MRMFQLCTCGEPLQLTEQATPKPVGSEVLLKVLAAGVCHSDLHLADGWFDLGGGKRLSLAERGMKLPVTLGTRMSARSWRSGLMRKVSASARACWRIRGSAAAPAGRAGAARRTSAAP